MSLTREQLCEQYDELMFADGFDEAIIGIVHRCGMEPVVCYDQHKCIEILMERGDGRMSYEEAVEYFDFNVAGGYHGPLTPVYLVRPEMET